MGEVPEPMRYPRSVPEVPFWVEINGRRVGNWTCSPDDLPALAVGWLIAEGYLRPGDELPRLEIVDDDGVLGVEVEIAAEGALEGDLERRHRREHGCGLFYYISCAPDRIGKVSWEGEPPDGELLVPLFQQLFELTREGGVGGLHAAALTDGVELINPILEVGRHNAVDKAIGRTLLEGRSTEGLGLILTARVSGEIALKAARARLSWIASRSVPTTLALAIAGTAGLPVLARTMGRDRYLHEPRPVSVEGWG